VTRHGAFVRARHYINAAAKINEEVPPPAACEITNARPISRARVLRRVLPQLQMLKARILDVILKRRKLADLPVEDSTKFEVVVNLRTVKSLGIRCHYRFSCV
jgi:hypothetical protein